MWFDSFVFIAFPWTVCRVFSLASFGAFALWCLVVFLDSIPIDVIGPSGKSWFYAERSQYQIMGQDFCCFIHGSMDRSINP
ncbi:MAG: hypothetical protein A3F89_05610 [Deltaproteobacteria bacterium RIFCSPLOWO2_12_FULL_50_11]|nr:MAG: hypothetical protein A3F89_05610 [Deltaproteobacteria bacterium RIFCSPLOWO2_12_FULL_50_11]